MPTYAARTQPNAPTTRPKFHMRHLKSPCQALDRALTRHPCSFPVVLLMILTCIMLAFWAATVAAFYHPDGINTWIILVIISTMFTLAVIGQAAYCIWDKREARLVAEREAQLEMARERGRMEGRREGVTATVTAGCGPVMG
ncbi:hypothetical protein BKA80DRAFT_33090 [Phyllosticta citrichinensis]